MAELVLVEQQVSLDEAGRLIDDAGNAVDCRVVQISRRSARVHLDGKLAAAENLYLSIAGFGQLSCRVRQQDGEVVDLRLEGDPETQEAIFQEIIAELGDEEGRRHYLRRSVLWPGTLKGPKGQYACTILNMSLGGAKVALSQEQICSGDMTLLGDRFEGLAANVTWQRGRMIGLQFMAEPVEIARILGDLLPVIKASA